MNDLISRQAAIEYFMTNTNWHDEDGYEIHDAEDKRALLKSYFDGIPSAQPERKSGRWIPKFDGQFKGGAYWFYCSECERVVPDVRNGGWSFCPQCGAKMEE